jgi:hypothetical protein
MNTNDDIDSDFLAPDGLENISHVDAVIAALIKNPSPHQMSMENDKKGLQAIHKFGWLRAREIGNVLWQTQPNRHISGARIARRWLKNKWVIQRTLPYGHGPAYILSKKGADLLDQEFDIQASSGKKIGDHISQFADHWIPSHSWRHDLLANSFLTLCMGGGINVISELELRRKYPGAKKLPDGLFEQTKAWWAIEVERSGKWSTNMRHLTKSLIDANTNGIEFGELLIKQVCLVYEDPNVEVDDGKLRPDHFGRVKRAAGSVLQKGQAFTLVGIPVQCKGGAVIEITTPLVEVVGDSYEKSYQNSVNGGEWISHRGESFYRFIHSGKFKTIILKNENSWNIHITFNPCPTDYMTLVNINIISDTEISVKRKALKSLLNTSEYRDVFDQIWFAKEIAADEPERLAQETLIIKTARQAERTAQEDSYKKAIAESHNQIAVGPGDLLPKKKDGILARLFR